MNNFSEISLEDWGLPENKRYLKELWLGGLVRVGIAHLPRVTLSNGEVSSVIIRLIGMVSRIVLARKG